MHAFSCQEYAHRLEYARRPASEFLHFVGPQCGTIDSVCNSDLSMNTFGGQLKLIFSNSDEHHPLLLWHFAILVPSMNVLTYLTVVYRSGSQWCCIHGALCDDHCDFVMCKGPAVQNDLRRKMLHWRCCNISMMAVKCHSAELVVTQTRN